MRHHEETIAGFTASRTNDRDTLGIVLVGSVARGEERPDSDVDVYLVVTDAAYAAAAQAGEIALVSHTGVTYADGYVDVKLASPGYLAAAADHGDDPTRASFAGGRVTLDRDGGLTDLVTRMGDLPAGVWSRRLRSYQAQVALYGGYFLGQAHTSGDRFLLAHSAVHTAYAAGRCALAQHHQLFRGQKYLAADLAALADLPSGFLQTWWNLLDEPTPAAAQTMIEILDDWLGHSQSLDESLSTFISDNELAWLNQTIPPEFW